MEKRWPLLHNNFMKKFTIMLVYHEDSSPDAIAMASVWIAAAERPAESPRELNGWFKIVGPIEMDVADTICSSLQSFFPKNGLEIKRETIAN